MAWNFFPKNLGSYKQSAYSEYLLTLRLFGIFLIGFWLFRYLFTSLPEYLVYLTDWGIILTFVYFLLSTSEYLIVELSKPVYVLFHIIWTFNWTISIAFWGYLFPVTSSFDDYYRASFTHSLPLMLTICDFLLNNIVINRHQYIFALGTLFVYLCGVLLPYTLSVQEVYIGISFENALSFGILVGLLIVAVLSLEAGRYARAKTCKNEELTQKILEVV